MATKATTTKATKATEQTLTAYATNGRKLLVIESKEAKDKAKMAAIIGEVIKANNSPDALAASLKAGNAAKARVTLQTQLIGDAFAYWVLSHLYRKDGTQDAKALEHAVFQVMAETPLRLNAKQTLKTSLQRATKTASDARLELIIDNAVGQPLQVIVKEVAVQEVPGDLIQAYATLRLQVEKHGFKMSDMEKAYKSIESAAKKAQPAKQAAEVKPQVETTAEAAAIQAMRRIAAMA